MSAATITAGLEGRLRDADYSVEEAELGGRAALVARRSDLRVAWMASRLHTFVIVQSVDTLDGACAQELALAAQSYAVAHKGGLPRGLQTGTATVAVLLGDRVEASARTYAEAKPKHRFAAMLLPVVGDSGGALASRFRGKRFVGTVYAEHLTDVMTALVDPSFELDTGALGAG